MAREQAKIKEPERHDFDIESFAKRTNGKQPAGRNCKRRIERSMKRDLSQEVKRSTANPGDIDVEDTIRRRD